MTRALHPHPNPLPPAGEGARPWLPRRLGYWLPRPSGAEGRGSSSACAELDGLKSGGVSPPAPGAVRGQRRIHSPQRGFSLLEILVAFAIAAMALGMLYRVSGNNARQVSNLVQHERAMILAQSLLAAHAVVPAQGLNESGQAAGYGWTVISRPYPTAVNNAAPQAARLHELRVDVAWQDGDVPRHFELSSIRPQRLPQPGEVTR